MRKFIFNAWLPAIETMLKNVSVHSDGSIGLSVDDFEKQTNLKYEVNSDMGYIEKVTVNEDGDNEYESVMPVLCSDDYLWFEEGFEILQYTGAEVIPNRQPGDASLDVTKKEYLFDGDLVSFYGEVCAITFSEDTYRWEISNSRNDYNLTKKKPLIKLGNKFENPELLK